MSTKEEMFKKNQKEKEQCSYRMSLRCWIDRCWYYFGASCLLK